MSEEITGRYCAICHAEILPGEGVQGLRSDEWLCKSHVDAWDRAFKEYNDRREVGL